MIVKSKKVIGEGQDFLRKIWKGELQPFLTYSTHFNEAHIVGVLPQTISIIAAPSGGGKSYEAQKIEEAFLDEELNPQAKDYALLRCNWEMTARSLLVRRIQRETNLTIKEIFGWSNLPKEVKKKNKEIINEIVEQESDPRIEYSTIAEEEEVFFKEMEDYLKRQVDKKMVLVVIDHIGLVEGKDKRVAIETTLRFLNLMKKKYPNAAFIILSQLNREILKRTDPRFAAPNRGDLSNSDACFIYADVVMVKDVPILRGMKEYMHVFGTLTNSGGDKLRHKYDHLTQYMVSEDNKYTSFNTYNLCFYHYLKVREKNDPNDIDRDLYIEKFNKDLPDINPTETMETKWEGEDIGW